MSKEALISIELWKELAASPGFSKLEEHINGRINVLWQKIDNIRKEGTPSVEKGLVIQTLLSSITELEKILATKEWNVAEWKKAKIKGDVE